MMSRESAESRPSAGPDVMYVWRSTLRVGGVRHIVEEVRVEGQMVGTRRSMIPPDAETPSLVTIEVPALGVVWEFPRLTLGRTLESEVHRAVRDLALRLPSFSRTEPRGAGSLGA